MIFSEVESVLKYPVKTINKLYPHIKIYIFGSVIKGIEQYEDIDIIIIYDNVQDILGINAILKEAYNKLPFHFIWMTPSEEKELKFIEQQQAIDIQTIFSLC